MRFLLDESKPGTYLDWIRTLAAGARGRIKPPETIAAWNDRLETVRRGLTASFGRLPTTDANLEPEVLGVLDRQGYAIERLTFQTLPGVRASANFYRPVPCPDRRPAVLCVHGHWPWARIDPHVQARCLGLVRLGYAVLAIDAFGAGERAIDPKPGTYHGALVGGSLWPTSTSLLGLQVYENRRAVDYLVSRPEVDRNRLGITGASGGGNQTLYAGATDDRLKAVVPVCGVGRLEAYLGQACCVCEVLPGGLLYAETGDLLALIAPRHLLVINALRDAIQFSVGEARRSVDYARERYRLLGVNDRIRHLPIEGDHGYSKPMREALYGFLDWTLRGRGDGAAIAEPETVLEDPADLRCYPDGGARPRSIVSVPEFAIREGRRRLAENPPIADHKERWEADALRIKTMLREKIFGGFPKPVALDLVLQNAKDSAEAQLTSELRIRLAGRRFRSKVSPAKGSALLLRFEGIADVHDPLLRLLRESGRDVWSVELRATGRSRRDFQIVHGVIDHNPAEWSLWVGRPLLGQWVWDALRWIDAIEAFDSANDSRSDVVVVTQGTFGLVGLLATGFHPRVSACAYLGGLVGLIAEKPKAWSGIPLGLLAPSLLEAGDIGELAALAAPRPLLIAGAVEPFGEPAALDRYQPCFKSTRAIYSTFRAADSLTVSPDSCVLHSLKSWLLQGDIC